MLTNVLAEAARMRLTRKELADRLDVSLPTLRSWISGKPIPSNKLIEMTNLFHCSADYLIQNDGQADQK